MAKIKHIAIITMDPEKLAEFYTKVFDMEILGKSARGAIYITDGYINDSVNTAIHANGETIMSYGWKANGGTTTSATTTGGIASATRQVDTTSKFAIIGYTSASSLAV